MKKILLMLALMLPCLGAWAQTQTPVLTYENITELEELSAADAKTIRDLSAFTMVADVTISNSNNMSLLFSAVDDYTSDNTANNSIWGLGIGGNSVRYYVGPRDGGYYSSSNGDISTATKKIIFTYNGTTIKYYEDGRYLKSQSSTKALNTFDGANAKFYLGGVVYNSNTEFGKFNGTINKIEFYSSALNDDQIASLCYPTNAVANATKFVHGNVYTFQTDRGWLMAKEGTDFVYSSGKLNDVTPAQDNVNCQWVYYATEKGKYLYNVGVGKFISFNSENLNSIPLSESPTTSAIAFKNSTRGAYPILIGVENKVINQNLTNAKFTYGALLWGDGWTGNQNDLGSATLALSQGTATTDLLAALDEKVGKFEIWPEVVNILECFQPFVDYDDTNWGFANADDCEVYIALANAPESASLTDLKELVAKCRAFTLPVPKKFFRIKAVEGWNDDARYLGAKNSTASTSRAEYVANADKNTIFYGDGNSLVSYGSGNYLVSNSNFLGYNGVQSSGSIVKFKLASNGLSAAYNIAFNNGGRYLYVDNNNYTNAGSGTDTSNGYCFNLEEVTEIPVTISAAKFASFYAPVAMTVPTGVTAYYINSKKEVNGETWANLEPIANGVIPANTGVILYSETPDTYYLTVGGEATAIEKNWLTGTAASKYIEEDSYVLSNNYGIGLYLANKNQEGSTWLNNGFKAYLPVDNAETASGVLRFNFGGTTAIESVLNNSADANAPIYDLSGRRVMNTVKGGIYIQNGKKFIVK